MLSSWGSFSPFPFSAFHRHSPGYQTKTKIGPTLLLVSMVKKLHLNSVLFAYQIEGPLDRMVRSTVLIYWSNSRLLGNSSEKFTCSLIRLFFPACRHAYMHSIAPSEVLQVVRIFCFYWRPADFWNGSMYDADSGVFNLF